MTVSKKLIHKGLSTQIQDQLMTPVSFNPINKQVSIEVNQPPITTLHPELSL